MMRVRNRHGRRLLGALLAGILLGVPGCDDGRGPGTLRLEISAPVALGGVVVELRGRGIEGVDDLPGGWVEGYAFTDAAGAPGYRVVAVLSAPGRFDLGVRVADLDARLPSVQVLEASGADDQLLQALGSVGAALRR
ncbi:MAG TPA: hypothetical protein VLA43_04640 [Longimicrobiales bacterium]|nr:hypothetical protein [Longimicrobiales bacterium]